MDIIFYESEFDLSFFFFLHRGVQCMSIDQHINFESSVFWFDSFFGYEVSE